MERDFMGLAKAKVKGEASAEPIDAAPVRTLKMQWSFSNKNSTQIVSFHGTHQQEKAKTGFDSLACNGLVSITTSEAFDRNKLSKNNIAAPEKLAHYNTIHHHHHHPQTNQSNASVRSFAATSAHINPNSNGLVGTTGLRSSTNNNSVASAQLTIFYNGSVCAYDNISPEKAQAIMLLAGNGANTTVAASSSSSSQTRPANPVQTCTVSAKPKIQGLVLNQSPATETTTHLWPSPLPVTSVRATGQPGVRYNGGGVLASPDPLDTVPQFRKKSLARFLEKRKERVISSSPYGNKQSEEWGSPSEAVVSRRDLCTNS